MSSSEPSAGGVAAVLARAATAQPEVPFLFYRNARGHFRWWSYSLAAAFLEVGGAREAQLSATSPRVEREAVELLGGFLQAVTGEERDPAGGEEVLRVPAATERDIWIAWRPLGLPEERALARRAIAAGAAILVEPAAALHPELVAWARPTMISASAAELCELADGLAALAPRFLRRRWWRQRAIRLRLLIVSGQAGSDDLAAVAAKWRALSAEFAPRVVPISAASLV